MEKSFISFHQNYPNWTPANAGGKTLLESVHNFRARNELHRNEQVFGALQQSMFGPKFVESTAVTRENSSGVMFHPEDDASPKENFSPVLDSLERKEVEGIPFMQRQESDIALDLPADLGISKASAQKREPFNIDRRQPNDRESSVDFDSVEPFPGRVRMQRTTSSGFIHGGGALRQSSMGFTPHGSIFGQRSLIGSSGLDNVNPAMFNSVLRSVLRQENIDYENDFYWMNMVRCFCVRWTT